MTPQDREVQKLIDDAADRAMRLRCERLEAEANTLLKMGYQPDELILRAQREAVGFGYDEQVIPRSMAGD